MTEVARLGHVVIFAANIALAVMPSRNPRCLPAVQGAARPARPGWVIAFDFYHESAFCLIFFDGNTTPAASPNASHRSA